MKTKKDRKIAVENLSSKFLENFPDWRRVRGHDRYGLFHVRKVADDVFLRVTIGIHPDIDEVSVRVGWQPDGEQPERAQDPSLRGEGTLEQVRSAASPVEFSLARFSTPLGRLIRKGYAKTYALARNEADLAPEMNADIAGYAIPYFKLYLLSRGLRLT